MATTINDLESLILFFLNDRIKEAHAKEQYEVVQPYTDDMLSWKRPIQIQSLLIDNLVRVGTVGDGNCLLHSILFAGSPSYRAQNASTRTKLADAFRDVLKARDFELMELADVLYAEIGGISAMEEEFTTLHEHRENLHVLIAPLIAKLYGMNFLAVQLREGGELFPVRLTSNGYTMANPTILVNYIGGGVNLGNIAVSGDGIQHFESIVSFVPIHSVSQRNTEGNQRKTRKTRKTKTKTKLEMDVVASQFIFPPGDHSLLRILNIFGML